jgi:hypothetical protein
VMSVLEPDPDPTFLNLLDPLVRGKDLPIIKQK